MSSTQIIIQQSKCQQVLQLEKLPKIILALQLNEKDSSQTEILTQVWKAGVEFIVQISGQKMKAEFHLRWEQESGQDRGEAVTCLSIGTKVNVAMLPIVTPRSYRILYWGKVSSGMLLIAIFTRPSYFGKKFSVPCCQLTVYISRPTLKTLPAFFHVSSFFW